MRSLLNVLIASSLLCFLSPGAAQAQSEPGRAGFGFNVGGAKYFGEFTDNQWWLGGDLYFRYNAQSWLSLQLQGGFLNPRYKTETEERLQRYTDFFGDNARLGDLYPGSTEARIERQNNIRVWTGDAIVAINILPRERFVPFVFGGIGVANFTTFPGQTGDIGLGARLRADAAGDNTAGDLAITFPVGAGFELYLNDNAALTAKATWRFTNSPWLDDYNPGKLRNPLNPSAVIAAPQGVENTGNDALFNVGVGLTYYVFGDADFDKDGLSNAYEKELGTDPNNPDTDADGLTDGDEVRIHGTNPKAADTDGDNLTDADELFKFKTDPRLADTDVDGLNDGQEITRKTDPRNPDTDGDGLLDGEEVSTYQTDPNAKDTDGDGLDDGSEVRKYRSDPLARDTDKDQLPDGDEVNIHKTDPTLADTDGDGLSDGSEVNTHKTDPLKPDSDGDGLDDGSEVNTHKTNPLKPDSDADGLSDGSEVNIHKTNPLKPDTDGDTLSDGDEVNTHKTDPLKADTDGDELADGKELELKTDPLKADTDGDTLPDGREVMVTRTNPLNPDTDGDTVGDGVDACPLVAGEPNDDPKKNGCPPPPKVGTKVDFPEILFVVNTDEFNFNASSTYENLAKLLEYMKQCDGLQVALEGHASSEGNAKRNQKLSDDRAKKVRQWLIEQGVDPKKIVSAIGYGSTQPAVAEPSAAEAKGMTAEQIEAVRKQNRRISVKVTKTCD